MVKFFLVPETLVIWPNLRLWLLIFQVPGPTWPVFKNCFYIFEHERVFYDLKASKI